jgi:hypothetical protein
MEGHKSILRLGRFQLKKGRANFRCLKDFVRRDGVTYRQPNDYVAALGRALLLLRVLVLLGSFFRRN